MNSDHHFLHFSESHWEHPFSYGFHMTSSCYNTCAVTKVLKLHHFQFRLIFPTSFLYCYVSIIRSRFVKVTNHSTNMSDHVALQAAHDPQTTLCVAFGARCFRTNFRRLCTSWPDLWASTPPRPPIIPKMGTSRHLLVNHPPHRCHPHLTSARFLPNLRSLSPP